MFGKAELTFCSKFVLAEPTYHVLETCFLSFDPIIIKVYLLSRNLVNNMSYSTGVCKRYQLYAGKDR
jgi:hypothetical protein